LEVLRTCSRPGCDVLTIGALCVGHDRLVARVFTRGRPFHSAPAGFGTATAGIAAAAGVARGHMRSAPEESRVAAAS
jgi:hypothetical protein